MHFSRTTRACPGPLTSRRGANARSIPTSRRARRTGSGSASSPRYVRQPHDARAAQLAAWPIEMRGRIDTRLGLWPAFWTVGVSGAWPRTEKPTSWSSTAASSWPTWRGAALSLGRAVWDDSKRRSRLCRSKVVRRVPRVAHGLDRRDYRTQSTDSVLKLTGPHEHDQRGWQRRQSVSSAPSSDSQPGRRQHRWRSVEHDIPAH